VARPSRTAVTSKARLPTADRGDLPKVANSIMVFFSETGEPIVIYSLPAGGTQAFTGVIGVIGVIGASGVMGAFVAVAGVGTDASNRPLRPARL